MSEDKNLIALCNRIGVQAWLETKSVLLLDAAENETKQPRKDKLQEFGEMLRTTSECFSAQIALCEKMAVEMEFLKEKIKILTLEDVEPKPNTDDKVKKSAIQQNNDFLGDANGDAPF